MTEADLVSEDSIVGSTPLRLFVLVNIKEETFYSHPDLIKCFALCIDPMSMTNYTCHEMFINSKYERLA